MIKCINLDKGLRIGNNGAFKACCLAESDYVTDGKVLKAGVNSFEEALESDTANKVREAFAKGERHSYCQKCWSEEDAGLESKRMRDNKRSTSFKDSDLYFLELNLGNTCNMACRMCNIGASSRWREDHMVLNPLDNPDDVKRWVKQNNASFEDDSKFWDDLYAKIGDVKVLDLYGGEPMLLKKQWEVLQHSVDNGTSKDQYVHFNTNGTIYNQKYVKILEQYKQADISFSIDGIEKQFEYIRYPGNWKEVEATMERWLNACKHMSNVSFNICYTLTIPNILGFTDMARWARDHDIRIHPNFVHYPPHYSITNIPEHAKDKIAEILEADVLEFSDNEELSEFYKVIVNMMRGAQCDVELYDKFLEVTRLLDESRNQDFKTTYPILYKILNESNSSSRLLI